MEIRHAAVILALAAANVGCGASVAETARSAISRSARGLVIVEDGFAPAYELARAEARASLPSLDVCSPAQLVEDNAACWAALDERLEPWEACRSAMSGLRNGLTAFEAAIDAKEADWIGQAACVAKSLSALRAAMRNVGLDPPAILVRAESGLRSLANRCERRAVFGPGVEAEGRHDP